jgi:hypothetical protein
LIARLPDDFFVGFPFLSVGLQVLVDEFTIVGVDFCEEGLLEGGFGFLLVGHDDRV